MNAIKKIAGFLYLVYALLVFVATMLAIYPFFLIIWPLTDPLRTRVVHIIFRVWMNVYLPLVFCPVFRKGKHYFKKGENYVVVLNHNSLADIPVSSPWIPGPNKTLGKIEMSKTPLFGLIYRMGAIIVDRKNEASRRESIVKMQDALGTGIHLCLYPEGTRNKTSAPLQPFFDGAFVTAIKAQRPIVPGLLFNTAKILPHYRKLWARPYPIHIHFLEPVPTAGLTLADVPALKERVHEIMEKYYIAHRNI